MAQHCMVISPLFHQTPCFFPASSFFLSPIATQTEHRVLFVLQLSSDKEGWRTATIRSESIMGLRATPVAWMNKEFGTERRKERKSARMRENRKKKPDTGPLCDGYCLNAFWIRLEVPSFITVGGRAAEVKKTSQMLTRDSFWVVMTAEVDADPAQGRWLWSAGNICGMPCWPRRFRNAVWSGLREDFSSFVIFISPNTVITEESVFIIMCVVPHVVLMRVAANCI